MSSSHELFREGTSISGGLGFALPSWGALGELQLAKGHLDVGFLIRDVMSCRH